MKEIYLTASLLVFTISAFAQKVPKDSLKDIPSAITASDIQKLLPQITAKSPNVAGLERHGDYPVNMYAGLPNIEIPLYEIKVGNLVVPIKLAYHASGNKVTDNASFVGLGWSLVGDYVISRNVRGLADEKDFSNNNSLLQKNLQLLPQLTPNCITEQLRMDFMDYINGGKDAERDIFTYYTPKKSNSFVILPNQTGVIWQESDKSIFSYSGALQNLSILDEDGVKYLYETPEATVMPPSGTGNVSAWHLKEIQGVKATDKITFSYQINNRFDFTGDIVDSEVYHTDIGGADGTEENIKSGFQGNFNTPSTPGVTPQFLKEIIFPSGKIVFVLSTANRQDNLGKSLEAVEIYGFNVATNQYVLQKKFTFTYIYKQRINTFTGNVVLFLDKVNLVSTNNNTVLGSYRFSYNTQALPAATSTAKDFWGYYNAQTQNTTLIPSLTYTGLVFSSYQTFQIGGANRDVNALAADAWMLTRIFYPMGGYSTFEYECNRYLDANNTMQLAGGQRIKSIVSDDNTGVTKTKTYKYGIGESGNGTLRSQAFKFFSTVQNFKHPPQTAGDEDYKYTVRIFSSANTLAINPNEGSPVTYPVVTEYEDNGTGANGKTIYTYKDDVFDNLIVLLTNGKSAQRSRHWNRGQLISRVTYGFDGKKKYEQTNTYTTIVSDVSSTIGYLVGQAEIRLNGASANQQNCYENDAVFNAIAITWDYGLVKQTSSIEKYYDNQDVSKFTTKKSETTYSPIHYQPTEMKEYVSNSIILGKLLWYAQDFATIPTTASVTGEVKALRSLQQRNILTTVMEEIDYRKDLLVLPPPDAQPLTITGGKFTTFEALSIAGIEKAIVPKTVSLTECLFNTFLNPNYSINFVPASGLFNPATHTSTLPRNVNHKTRIYFDTYDADGNLTTFHQSDGATTKYVYSTAINDGLSFVYPTSEIQNYVSPNPLGLKALTTNFSFTIPLLGMDSMTDQSGLKTYFEYDTFSRLLQIKDHNGKIVKKYQYQY